MAELFKLVQIENSKRKKLSAKQKRAEKAKEAQVKKEAEKKVEVIRQKKKAAKKASASSAAKEEQKPKPVLKVGDRVRMHDGRAVGSIDAIEKEKAIVNYGLFTTNVSLDLLELVEAGK